MPKQLQALRTRWVDVQADLDKVWGDLAKLIMQYRNVQSGAWPRLITLYEMLDERLAELGVESVSERKNDPQLKTLMAEIGKVRALCRKISAQYWERKGTAFDDLRTLQRDFEKAIKEKKSTFFSQSLPALKKLQKSVNTMNANAQFFLKDEPPKPDDPVIE